MKKHVGTNEMNKEFDATTADPAFQSRRRLLKLGAYVPPAILGMAIISSTAHAGATGSCNPSACNPCRGGGKTKQEQQKDARDCYNAQKKRS